MATRPNKYNDPYMLAVMDMLRKQAPGAQHGLDDAPITVPGLDLSGPDTVTLPPLDLSRETITVPGLDFSKEEPIDLAGMDVPVGGPKNMSPSLQLAMIKQQRKNQLLEKFYKATHFSNEGLIPGNGQIAASKFPKEMFPANSQPVSVDPTKLTMEDWDELNRQFGNGVIAAK